MSEVAYLNPGKREQTKLANRQAILDGARRFRPILHAEYEKATDFESYLRGAVRAYFDFIAAEDKAWGEHPPHQPEPITRSTPEILAVHEEVKSAFAGVMERGLAPRVDLDYLATACIAIAREVGDKMLDRRPPDVEGATEFCVQLILGGLAALPRVAP
jgi:hypothetical protein